MGQGSPIDAIHYAIDHSHLVLVWDKMALITYPKNIFFTHSPNDKILVSCGTFLVVFKV